MRPKSILKFFVLTLLTLGASIAQASDENTLAGVRAKMAAMFTEIEPQHVNHSPIDGWYTVQKGSIVAYVSADGRYLLQGDLIDLDSQTNLTDVARNDARRSLMASVSDDQYIAFSPSKVKHSITVFTDIDCTYCRKMHTQIDDYLELGIEIKYVLYPRNGPASRSWNTSEEVWCASDRNSALTAAKLDRSFESHKCSASQITKGYSLGRDVGLTGTPAVLLEDGTLLSGYLPPQAMSMRLDQVAAAAK